MTAQPPDVLVIEDDATIGGHLQAGLRSSGYPTSWCRTGSAALAQARATAPAVVLLDLGLPDLDGVDLARVLRSEQPDLLLVILTARTREIDIVVGLDAGADDYLVKPFGLSVLLARLRAHLRRRPVAATDAVLCVGALTVDLRSRRCLLDGYEVSLRPKEFDLLAVLADRPGTAVRREDLMSAVWDENWFGPTKTLDVTMAALRRRLTEAGLALCSAAAVPVITTLRGHGYRLEQGPETLRSTQ